MKAKDYYEIEGEEWYPIDGTDGRYEVSNMGRVRVLRTRYGNPCNELRGSYVPGRYAAVYIGNHAKGYNFRIHTLVAAAFLGPCPDGYEVHHKDNDKSNPRLDNLEYVTYSHNATYAIRDGLKRIPRGSENKSAKLNDDMVRRIRRDQRSTRTIGAEYGISSKSVSEIKRRKAWAWVA